MPERLARTDPFTQVTEMVGSVSRDNQGENPLGNIPG
jgi:hypothetical protein